MDTPIAAVIAGNPATEMSGRLSGLLEFFGVPSQIFAHLSEFQHAAAAGSLRSRRYSIIGSITQLAALIEGEDELARKICRRAESLFCYLDKDILRCSQLLQKLVRSPSAALVSLGGKPIEVEVSKCCPAVTSSLHGLCVAIRPGLSDHALAADDSAPLSKIIETRDYPCFFEIEHRGIRTFVSCTADLPDLKRPLKGRYYDIKEDFLSAVPIVTYVKWAFRDSCWQNSRPGACLIIDDPILKTKYGFCDFRRIDRQMRELGFSTNISLIPWNWRRTSEKAAALIRNSESRFSISIHGCNHTGNEFATSAIPTLNRKVMLANQRMEKHRQRSHLSHDPIMVFPQGAFSRESLAVLQQHQFLAAVNTEVRPMDGRNEIITIEDVWKVAILKYGGFPLFARRYPSHRLENFAFDVILGKPCLVVEHHEFFKDDGRGAVKFINTLNSLNCRLRWRSLGEVLRRVYQWRAGTDGAIQIRMFANELVLHNPEEQERSYCIEKASEDSAGIEYVSIDARHIQWQTKRGFIAFSCKVPPKTEIRIRVRYQSAPESNIETDSLTDLVRTAMRRYLSEFRDNFLSQHEGLMLIPQTAKHLVRSYRRGNSPSPSRPRR